MKKLIAISVVFALVLGAAFAQPSLGGNFKVGTKILGGQSENKNDEVKVMAGGMVIDSAGLNVNFGDADAGGKIVFFHNAKEGVPGHMPVFAFAWWRPIPQVRIHMGANADGDFGFDQIAGWGFEAEAKSVGAAISQYGDMPAISKIVADQSAYGPSAWGPGFGELGLLLSVYPIDGLQINLGIPGGQARAAKRYTEDMLLSGSFVLEDIGTIRLGAKFGSGNFDRYVPSAKELSGEVEPNYHWRESTAESHGTTTIWAAFHLTAIEGLGAELGIGYKLPYTTQDVKFVDVPGSTIGQKLNVGGVGYGILPVNTKVNTPLSLGLGADFNAGDLGVKARAAFSFAGSTVVNKSKNDALEAERKAAKEKGYYSDHIPTNLILNSATYYVQETTKGFDAFYKSDNTADYYSNKHPVVEEVEWTPKSGTQTKIADPFVWGLNVKPSYKLGDVTIFLNLGIGMKHYAKQEVTLQKTELRTYKDGNGREHSYYDDVYAEKITYSDGSWDYDTTSAPVMITETFKGKPGFYFTETNIDMPTTNAAYNDLMKNAKTVKADIDWFVNPYVSIPAGGGQFYVGFKLFTDGTRIPVKFNYNKANVDNGGVAGKFATDDGKEITATSTNKPLFGTAESTKYRIKWSIPIGFNFYF